MPGPVSDSYDPEFGTGVRAGEVREALNDIRDCISADIGSDELQDIVDLAERYNAMTRRPLWNQRAPGYCEEALRIIRFAIDRALESI